jgi:hypothetical protein
MEDEQQKKPHDITLQLLMSSLVTADIVQYQYSYWCHPLLLLILFSINTVTDVIPCYCWYCSVSRQLLMSSLVTADIVQYQDSYWCHPLLLLILCSINTFTDVIPCYCWYCSVSSRGFKVFYNRRYFLNFRRYLKN